MTLLMSSLLHRLEATPPSSSTAAQLDCHADCPQAQRLSLLDHAGVCSGFYSSGDNSDEDVSQFVCERKTFNSLCAGLTQTCPCHANAQQVTKAIQVQL